jgi:hypothetical protein|tara:strand:+ start:560 stop:838 length:279 start_codon:yes stop_codon:yes gene_type:complete
MPKGKGTYGSKVGRPPKTYQSGGLVKGKSHKDGGELIEVEGNEIVVNDSVNGAAEMHGEGLLALNENPEDYAIVPISNAMERMQVFRDEDVA